MCNFENHVSMEFSKIVSNDLIQQRSFQSPDTTCFFARQTTTRWFICLHWSARHCIESSACTCRKCRLCLFSLPRGPSEKSHPTEMQRGRATVSHVWEAKCSQGRSTDPESEALRAWFDDDRVANRNWMPKKGKAAIHHLILLIRVHLEGHGLLVCDGEFGSSRNEDRSGFEMKPRGVESCEMYKNSRETSTCTITNTMVYSKILIF